MTPEERQALADLQQEIAGMRHLIYVEYIEQQGELYSPQLRQIAEERSKEIAESTRKALERALPTLCQKDGSWVILDEGENK